MSSKKKTIIILAVIYFIFLIGFNVSADYKIDVSIPKGADEGTEVGLKDYIRYLYLFGLGAVGVLALIFLIIGGFLYMFSDTVTSKDKAREYISGALIGLVLGLGAYLILKTINPDLVKINPPILPDRPQPESILMPNPAGLWYGQITDGTGNIIQCAGNDATSCAQSCASLRVRYGGTLTTVCAKQ